MSYTLDNLRDDLQKHDLAGKNLNDPVIIGEILPKVIESQLLLKDCVNILNITIKPVVALSDKTLLDIIESHGFNTDGIRKK